MTPYQTETITHNGRDFLVSLHVDDVHGAPWREFDGHGSVEYLQSQSDRTPRGWVHLAEEERGPGRYIYDFGGAILQAARDKWGVSPETLASLGPKPSRSKIRAAAVRADMDYLRGWIRGDWCYLGVCVQIIGPDGNPEGDEFTHALWGVESKGEYWREVASDLADEILDERKTAWMSALREARARKYWASRDVVTIGA